MKRFVSFAAVLALLGGMAFLALPSDDAVAQSRVKINLGWHGVLGFAK
jgi:hypothetical protein